MLRWQALGTLVLHNKHKQDFLSIHFIFIIRLVLGSTDAVRTRDGHETFYAETEALCRETEASEILAEARSRPRPSQPETRRNRGPVSPERDRGEAIIPEALSVAHQS